jgi:hypothetical protein
MSSGFYLNAFMSGYVVSMERTAGGFVPTAPQTVDYLQAALISWRTN